MPREILFRLTRKDFRVDAYTGHGKGGQNRNRRKTACRITHPPSGAVGQSQEQREYKRNERTAFLRLLETPKFKLWHNKMCLEKMGILKKVEEQVEEAMKPDNLSIDVKDEKGRWVKE